MLNSIEVSISKDLIDSYISHDKFVLVINVLREYDDIKEVIINFRIKISIIHHRFQSIYKTVLSYCLRCSKNTESNSPKVVKIKWKNYAFITMCGV